MIKHAANKTDSSYVHCWLRTNNALEETNLCCYVPIMKSQKQENCFPWKIGFNGMTKTSDQLIRGGFYKTCSSHPVPPSKTTFCHIANNKQCTMEAFWQKSKKKIRLLWHHTTFHSRCNPSFAYFLWHLCQTRISMNERALSHTSLILMIQGGM